MLIIIDEILTLNEFLVRIFGAQTKKNDLDFIRIYLLI